MKRVKDLSRIETLIDGYINQTLKEKEMEELEAELALSEASRKKFESAIEKFIDDKTDHKIKNELEKQIISTQIQPKWLNERAKIQKNEIILDIARIVLDREPGKKDFADFNLLKSDEAHCELLMYKDKTIGHLNENYSKEFTNVVIGWDFLPNEFYKKLITANKLN